MALLKRTERQHQKGEDMVTQSPPQTTQQKLDVAVAERASFERRRDLIAASVAERKKEIGELARRVALNDPTAIQRVKELQVMLDDHELEAQAVTSVMADLQPAIDRLATERSSEIAAEQHEAKLRGIKVHEDQMVSAIENAFSAAHKLLEAARVVQNELDQIRNDGHAAHCNWSRLREAHSKAFVALLSVHGPIERFSLPSGLFQHSPF